MNLFIGLFAISVLIAFLYGLACFYRNIFAAPLFALVIIMGYLGFNGLLGRPKPIELEWFIKLNNVPVLYYNLVENEAIYLLLQVEDIPRWYKLSWSKEQAQNLQDATKEASEQGTGVYMTGFMGTSGLDERKPMFYAPPRERLRPDKM